MSRKSRKGYYVDGEFIAAGSDADRQLRSELKDSDGPSRTELKNASQKLQELGAELLTLRASLFDGLPLPSRLRETILEAKRMTSFGAKRRQLQLIGKLMRGLEPEALESVQAALRLAHGQSAQAARILHRAEQWRDSLIVDDERLKAWIEAFPGTDAQHLRALIRQARKDAREAKPGEAQRQGRAYRQIFALVRLQLSSSPDI
jgi:ribosome-associated protein